MSAKTNASFLVRADDSLHKLQSKDLASFSALSKQIERFTKTRSVHSLRQFADALKQNNRGFDDLTIVYFEDKESPVSELALRMLRHESQHQVVQIRNPELAQILKIKPGKFYCYYKPTFIIDGFEDGPY